MNHRIALTLSLAGLLLVACDTPLDETPAEAGAESAASTSTDLRTDEAPEFEARRADLLGGFDALGQYIEFAAGDLCGPTVSVSDEDLVLGSIDGKEMHSTSLLNGGKLVCPCTEVEPDISGYQTCKPIYVVAKDEYGCLKGIGCKTCKGRFVKVVPRDPQGGVLIKDNLDKKAAAELLDELFLTPKDALSCQAEPLPADEQDALVFGTIKALNGIAGVAAISQSKGALPLGFSLVQVTLGGKTVAIPVNDQVIALAKVTAADPPSHCSCDYPDQSTDECDLTSHSGGAYYTCESGSCYYSCTMHGSKSADAPVEDAPKKK